MSSIPDPLLVVEDTFMIRGRYLIVTPHLPVDEYPLPHKGNRYIATVILERPDGTMLETEADFIVPICALPIDRSAERSVEWHCTLPSCTKQDVPIGTVVRLKNRPANHGVEAG